MHSKNSYVRLLKHFNKIFVPCDLADQRFDSFREDEVTLTTTNRFVVKQDTALAREQFQFDFRYRNPKRVCDKD